jgi:hypothetical protein
MEELAKSLTGDGGGEGGGTHAGGGGGATGVGAGGDDDELSSLLSPWPGPIKPESRCKFTALALKPPAGGLPALLLLRPT